MCTELQIWVSKIGLKPATDLINEAEVARGNKPVTYQAVQQWLSSQVPPLRVLGVERASGVSRTIIHPDIYPPDAA